MQNALSSILRRPQESLVTCRQSRKEFSQLGNAERSWLCNTSGENPSQSTAMASCCSLRETVRAI